MEGLSTALIRERADLRPPILHPCQYSFSEKIICCVIFAIKGHNRRETRSNRNSFSIPSPALSTQRARPSLEAAGSFTHNNAGALLRLPGSSSRAVGPAGLSCERLHATVLRCTDALESNVRTAPTAMTDACHSRPSVSGSDRSKSSSRSLLRRRSSNEPAHRYSSAKTLTDAVQANSR